MDMCSLILPLVAVVRGCLTGAVNWAVRSLFQFKRELMYWNGLELVDGALVGGVRSPSESMHAGVIEYLLSCDYISQTLLLQLLIRSRRGSSGEVDATSGVVRVALESIGECFGDGLGSVWGIRRGSG